MSFFYLLKFLYRFLIPEASSIAAASASGVNVLQRKTRIIPSINSAAARIRQVYCTEYTSMPSVRTAVSPVSELTYVPVSRPRNAQKFRPSTHNTIH